MNFCGKSFHIVIKTVFQLGNGGKHRCLSDSVPALHPIQYTIIHWHDINLVHFRLFLQQNPSCAFTAAVLAMTRKERHNRQNWSLFSRYGSVVTRVDARMETRHKTFSRLSIRMAGALVEPVTPATRCVSILYIYAAELCSVRGVQIV